MFHNEFFNVSQGQINDKVSKNEKVIVIKNIRYPVFESHSPEFQKLCSVMNVFYKKSAEKFSLYATCNFSKKYSKSKQTSSKPFGAVMNFSVSFYDRNFVCVVTDVSGFDGNETYSSRFSHTWSREKLSPMPSSYFINHNKNSRSFIKQEIIEIIRKNMTDSSFGYYGDAQKLFLKYFDFENFYFVPKGIAFFIDAGIMSDAKYGPSVFIIPFEMADGMLKIAPLLQDSP